MVVTVATVQLASSKCSRFICGGQDNEPSQHHATQWLWTYNNERPNMGIGGITPAQKLLPKGARSVKMAA